MTMFCLTWFLTHLKRCLDRGCSSDMKKTKKKLNKDWINLYTGPEFFIAYRYSQLLTIIFMCLLVSSGMPIMYLVTIIFMIVTYWIDKLLSIFFFIN